MVRSFVSCVCLAWLPLLGALGALSGCDIEAGGSGGAASGSEGIRVVATTTMIGDLVRQLAGEKVQLVVLMPPGVDPHSFKPSTADMGQLGRADLVLYNGLHLEGKMVDLLERELRERAVAVTRDIPQEKLLGWADGQGAAHDPHVWFDCQLWAQAARTAGAALAQADPSNAPHYRARSEQVVAELLALDEEVRSKIAQVPPERRVLITSHDAYNYFGRAYGIEVRGLQGISTETEAGISDISGAVDFIVSRKIPAIFVESSVSPRTIQRVQADCGSRGVEVTIGGELYSDAMGAPGEHAGFAVDTYAGMVRYNVETMVKALR